LQQKFRWRGTKGKWPNCPGPKKKKAKDPKGKKKRVGLAVGVVSWPGARGKVKEDPLKR